jgi:hypothetical protein
MRNIGFRRPVADAEGRVEIQICDFGNPALLEQNDEWAVQRARS